MVKISTPYMMMVMHHFTTNKQVARAAVKEWVLDPLDQGGLRV
jgi:hypothetical protein